MLESYEVFTALKMSMLVFCVVTTCGLVHKYHSFGGIYCLHFSPEDGGSMFLRNVAIDLRVHTALRPRRLTSTDGCWKVFQLRIPQSTFYRVCFRGRNGSSEMRRLSRSVEDPGECQTDVIKVREVVVACTGLGFLVITPERQWK
jgi:hypothetical protein